MNRTEWDPDGRYRPTPPSQPPGWVDPDPLYVDPELVQPRVRYQGWQLDPEPIGVRWAWLGLGICIGIVLFALVITVGRAYVDAAPRSASPAIPAAGSVPPASGNLEGLSGAPTGDVPTSLPVAALPSAGAIVSEPAHTPTPTGEVGTALIGGWATWYQDPARPLGGRYAAGGPLIRSAFDDWRGKTIRVTAGDRETVVRLVDFCACGERRGVPTVIDLSPTAFGDLALLSAGVIRVEIELVALPPTDTPDQHPEDPPEHPDDARMRLEDRD